jgi:hypothetical protein
MPTTHSTNLLSVIFAIRPSSYVALVDGPRRPAVECRFSPDLSSLIPPRRRGHPVAATVRIVVSDYGGAYATTILDEWMEPGRYAIDVDTRTFAPGVYIVQVHVGAEVGVAKFVVGN